MSDITLDPMGQEAAEIYSRVVSQVDWAEIERRKQAREPGETWDVTRTRFTRLDAEIQRRKAAREKDFTTEEALGFFHALPTSGEGMLHTDLTMILP